MARSRDKTRQDKTRQDKTTDQILSAALRLGTSRTLKGNRRELVEGERYECGHERRGVGEPTRTN